MGSSFLCEMISVGAAVLGQANIILAGDKGPESMCCMA